MISLRPLLPLLLLSSSCTALLGVEDAVLDEGSGDAATGGIATSISSSGPGGGGPSTTSQSSTASSGGGGGNGSTGGGSPSSSSSGGEGGDGGATSSSGSTGGDGSTSSGGGSGGSSSSGGGGGAGGGGSASSGGGGGAGGASTTSSGGGAGGAEPCDLTDLPACPGIQPNTFSLASDLIDHWDVLAPQASVTASDHLQLRVSNGTTEARIQAKIALDAPTACSGWLTFELPSGGANVASGLGIDTTSGLFSVYHVQGEVRAEDAQGGVSVVGFDGIATARIRARFDDVGDLWFDTSPVGGCWSVVDGPYVVDDGPLDIQIFVDRPGTSGAATSTFDDFSR